MQKKLDALRLLSLDPGTVNFGWSCLERDARGKVSVVRCGMFLPTVKELAEPIDLDVQNFHKQFSKLHKKSKAEILLSERYSTRIRGTTCEAVNMMIGAASLHHVKTVSDGEVSVIMPMTWKAAIKKWLNGPIETYYKEVGIKPHPTDASLLGLYYCCKYLGGEWPDPAKFADSIYKGFTDAFQVPS